MKNSCRLIFQRSFYSTKSATMSRKTGWHCFMSVVLVVFYRGDNLNFQSLPLRPAFTKRTWLVFFTDMSLVVNNKWVSWDDSYLFLGFGTKWNSWIMSCMETVSYSVLIERLWKEIYYPYYYFYAEKHWFTSTIHLRVKRDYLYGIHFMEVVRLFHILFADDSLSNVQNLCNLFTSTREFQSEGKCGEISYSFT